MHMCVTHTGRKLAVSSWVVTPIWRSAAVPGMNYPLKWQNELC